MSSGRAVLVLAGLLGLAGSAWADTSVVPVQWVSGGLQFTLQDQAGRCVLGVQGASGPAKLQPTALRWPCRFHLDPQGQVRSLSGGRTRTVLIESSVRLSERDCDTQLQAVRVTAGRVQVSPHHDRVASCPPFQWDPFVFNALF